MSQTLSHPDVRAQKALERALGGRALFESLPIGICFCDSEGVIWRFNRRAAELWGCSPKIGDTVQRFSGAFRMFLPDGRLLPHEAAPMAGVLRSRTPARDRRLVLERPDGSRIAVLVNIDPLFDEDGTLAGAVSCFQDISELARAEEGLRDGEQHFREVLEALPVAIYTTDAAGKVTFYNEAAVALTGRRPELGSDEWCVTWRLYHPDGTPLPYDQCPMAVALREQRTIRDMEAIAELPDGSRVRFLPFPTPLFDRDGRLRGAINMLLDITGRHRAEVESAHLAAIVASSDDAIISKTLDGTVRSWNAGATRIFGYEAEEMIGQPITKIIPGELHGEEAQILARLRRGERMEHFETVRVTKDGRRIDISLTVSPVRDRSGIIVGASKVARDVSERRRAEELQRLLIGELNHRVKNTLATVQSIANQTVRRAHSPADFAASFSGRIQALAKTHELLTQNAWRGADVLPLVRDQLLLGGDEKDRISLSGPSVTLEAQAALHLALILHELGTNARKYGSLSVPNGRLTVTWAVRANRGRELLLQWQESGGPAVRAPSARGFGTTLIEKSLAAHGGEAAVHYRADGVACDIRLPLADSTLSREGVPVVLPQVRASVAPPEPTGPVGLRGKRILVVEDEPLIAMDVGASLSDAGCEVVGPAASIESAKALIAGAAFDAALLDANLGGRPVDELAAALTRLKIPFIFLTGYGREGLPEAFRQGPVISKPFMPEQALAMLARLLQKNENVVQIRHKNT